MSTDKGDDRNKYEWQSWPADSLEGMPPKRRRLAVWALLWFVLLGTVLRSALHSAGIPEPWRSTLLAVVLAAVFVPLVRAAMTETARLRAEGVDVPSYAAYPTSRKALVSIAVITGVLWIIFAISASFGELFFPLVPISCTVWLAIQIRRWRTVSR